MEDRKSRILKTVVDDFVKTGKPVASGYLYKKYGGFGVKPAMIRRELSSLEDAGYLIQVHASGGRVPTDKAYRYFVNDILEEENAVLEGGRSKKLGSIAREFDVGNYDEFIKKASFELELLGVGFEVRRETMHIHGIHELVSRIISSSVSETEDILEILDDFESLSERIYKERNWWDRTEWPCVFIGRSPLTRSDCLSVTAARFRPRGRDFLFVAIGPKRMDYRKPLELFRLINATGYGQ